MEDLIIIYYLVVFVIALLALIKFFEIAKNIKKIQYSAHRIDRYVELVAKENGTVKEKECPSCHRTILYTENSDKLSCPACGSKAK
ncbi:MAG: hypothetical protein QM503_04620 [Bacteroidota bacterium]